MQNIRLIVAVLLSLTWWMAARGTLAGTAIANQAQIVYSIGGASGMITSNADTFVVDRIVDVHVNWQDSAVVQVAAGAHGRVLTYRVSNEGNGDDNVTLGHDHNASSDFLPTPIQIFQDSNHNGHYDPGVDTLVAGLTMGEDTNATLFIVGDIPDNNTTTPGRKSYEILRALSESNATAGADHPGSVDVVVRKQYDADQGTWMVRDYWLNAHKSAAVHSTDHAIHTGTRITYTIEFYIDGNAAGQTIQHVVIRDAVPAHTQYLPATLTLDGIAQTDAADGDHGQCDGTTVQVNAGDISGAGHHQITFDAEVQ